MLTDSKSPVVRPRGSGRRSLRSKARARLMIYGSTGYTGRLIAQRAVEMGLAPILAGRRADRVRRQAEVLGLPWRAVALDAPEELASAVSQAAVFIHAAGPFSATARPMIEACLRARTHYLDIAGELVAFQEASRLDRRAIDAGVMLMPGAAWSVVASDCLAAHVAAGLPGAKYLRIGIAQSRLHSRGTARSALGLLQGDITIRRNGRLTSVPIGRLERAFDYGEGERSSLALSFPDVVSAYHTTGIPNIEVYVDVGAWTRVLAPLSARLGEVLQLPYLRSLLRLGAETLPEGPAAAARLGVRHVIVGEAEDSWRRRVSARLRTADGYGFTAEAAVAIAERVIRGEYQPGFQTPGRIYGPDFVLGLGGAMREDLVQDSAAQVRSQAAWSEWAQGAGA